MGNEVAWLLEMTVNPGALETVRELTAKMVESARSEAGTLSYAWHVSDDGSRVVAYERYADDAAALAHVATFGERFVQRVLEVMTPARFTVFGAPSDEVRQAISIFNPTYLGFFGGFPAR